MIVMSVSHYIICVIGAKLYIYDLWEVFRHAERRGKALHKPITLRDMCNMSLFYGLVLQNLLSLNGISLITVTWSFKVSDSSKCFILSLFFSCRPQMNPVRILTTYFFDIHYSPAPSGFFLQICVHFHYPHAWHMIRPSHYSLFDHHDDDDDDDDDSNSYTNIHINNTIL
jgi:hypothetical protein